MHKKHANLFRSLIFLLSLSPQMPSSRCSPRAALLFTYSSKGNILYIYLASWLLKIGTRNPVLSSGQLREIQQVQVFSYTAFSDDATRKNFTLQRASRDFSRYFQFTAFKNYSEQTPANKFGQAGKWKCNFQVMFSPLDEPPSIFHFKIHELPSHESSRFASQSTWPRLRAFRLLTPPRSRSQDLNSSAGGNFSSLLQDLPKVLV